MKNLAAPKKCRLIYGSTQKVEWNERHAKFYTRWPRAGSTKFGSWVCMKTVPMTKEVMEQIESLRPRA